MQPLWIHAPILPPSFWSQKNSWIARKTRIGNHLYDSKQIKGVATGFDLIIRDSMISAVIGWVHWKEKGYTGNCSLSNLLLPENKIKKRCAGGIPAVLREIEMSWNWVLMFIR